MSEPGSRKGSVVKPVQLFSSSDQRVIIRYLYQQDVDSSEIHKLLTAACGKEAPTYKDVREWIIDLDHGKQDPNICVCDAGGTRKKSGMTSESSTDPALIARLESLLNADNRISIEKLTEMTMVSIQTAQTVVTNLLGLKRVREKWVPRIWTPEQRAYRVAVCQELLQLYHSEGADFLSRVVVGDEAFALYCTSPNGKTGSSGGKYTPAGDIERVYHAIYFDNKGVLVSETLQGSEVTIEEYISIIKDFLLPAIRRKRGLPSGPIYLLQSITPIHCSLESLKVFKELNIIPLPHAPASPDLEPFEYWLFRNLKRALDNLNFQSRAEMASAFQRQLHSHSEIDFHTAIGKMIERWNICIEKQGLYLL